MSDGVKNFLSVNDSLVFESPIQLDNEDFNYVECRPIAGETFSPNSTATFRLNSSNEVIDWSRTYYSGNFTGDTVGSVITSAGIASIFQTVQDSIQGYSLPSSLTDYNLTHSLENLVATTERKTWFDITELSGNTTLGSTSTPFTLPVSSQLASSNKYFPLAIINGGIELNTTFAPASNVFKYVGSDYTITNFRLFVCFVRPSGSYLNELSSGVLSGRALKIPLELKRVFHQPLSTSLSQTLKIQTGFLKSINSITLVIRDASKLNSTSSNTDAFRGIGKLHNIDYLNISVNSIAYPRQGFFRIANNRPQLLMNILTGFNTKYSALTCPTSTTDDFFHYNFKSNEGFGSGITSNDGFIELNLNMATAFNSGDLATVIVNYDCMTILQDGVVTFEV